LTISIIIYFFLRGIIKPLFVKERLNFLLPINWIFIGVLGLIIDLVKAPGMIYGSLLYIYRRLKKMFSK